MGWCKVLVLVVYVCVLQYDFSESRAFFSQRGLQLIIPSTDSANTNTDATASAQTPSPCNTCPKPCTVSTCGCANNQQIPATKTVRLTIPFYLTLPTTTNIIIDARQPNNTAETPESSSDDNSDAETPEPRGVPENNPDPVPETTPDTSNTPDTDAAPETEATPDTESTPETPDTTPESTTPLEPTKEPNTSESTPTDNTPAKPTHKPHHKQKQEPSNTASDQPPSTNVPPPLPSESPEPATSEEPATPIASDTPTKPAEPSASAEPAVPAEPAEPAEPAIPAEPAATTEPAEPGSPAEPTVPSRKRRSTIAKSATNSNSASSSSNSDSSSSSSADSKVPDAPVVYVVDENGKKIPYNGETGQNGEPNVQVTTIDKGNDTEVDIIITYTKNETLEDGTVITAVVTEYEVADVNNNNGSLSTESYTTADVIVDSSNASGDETNFSPSELDFSKDFEVDLEIGEETIKADVTSNGTLTVDSDGGITAEAESQTTATVDGFSGSTRSESDDVPTSTTSGSSSRRKRSTPDDSANSSASSAAAASAATSTGSRPKFTPIITQTTLSDGTEEITIIKENEKIVKSSDGSVKSVDFIDVETVDVTGDKVETDTVSKTVITDLGTDDVSDTNAVPASGDANDSSETYELNLDNGRVLDVAVADSEAMSSNGDDISATADSTASAVLKDTDLSSADEVVATATAAATSTASTSDDTDSDTNSDSSATTTSASSRRKRATPSTPTSTAAQATSASTSTVTQPKFTPIITQTTLSDGTEEITIVREKEKIVKDETSKAVDFIEVETVDVTGDKVVTDTVTKTVITDLGTDDVSDADSVPASGDADANSETYEFNLDNGRVVDVAVADSEAISSNGDDISATADSTTSAVLKDTDSSSSDAIVATATTAATSTSSTSDDSSNSDGNTETVSGAASSRRKRSTPTSTATQATSASTSTVTRPKFTPIITQTTLSDGTEEITIVRENEKIVKSSDGIVKAADFIEVETVDVTGDKVVTDTVTKTVITDLGTDDVSDTDAVPASGNADANSETYEFNLDNGRVVDVAVSDSEAMSSSGDDISATADSTTSAVLKDADSSSADGVVATATTAATSTASTSDDTDSDSTAASSDSNASATSS